MSQNQRGALHILILVAAFGLVAFLLISETFNFKDKLFGSLYPKPISKAVSTTTGANFALSANPATVLPGQEIAVTILVRTDTHWANLFSAQINFDVNQLEVARIDIAGTFVTQWVERVFDNTTGRVSIVGGVPKPGFQTTGSDVVMATVVFLAKTSGTSDIIFDPTSAVYRNSDNVNFLTSTTNATVIIQPTASPSPAPSLSPSPSPSSSPDPSLSPSPSPVACSIISASWANSVNPVNEGTIIKLDVNGQGDCLAKQVLFEIREDDGLLGFDPVFSNPVNGIFDSLNTTSTSWAAEYQPDGFDGINDPPEYYFIASLVDDISITARSSDPKLLVNQATTTIFKQGDANRNNVVDLQDLSILLSYWFETTNFPDELDINGDNIINTFDFSGMLVILRQDGIIQ